jgi:dihydrofolate reductase
MALPCLIIRAMTTPVPLLSIIVAMDAARGIGIDNTLPWRLPEDLAHFKRLTSGHAIIMGRKTFDSIGRVLPNRRHIVITRNTGWKHDNVHVVHSLDEAVREAGGSPAYIIGGGEIFSASMDLADQLIVTEINKTFTCDAFFPPIDGEKWAETARETHHSAENGFDYAFVTYNRR